MPKALIIDDEPHWLGVHHWPEMRLPEGAAWDVVTNPACIPGDLTPYGVILLDHRMPRIKGDAVARKLVRRGYPADRIVRVSSLREGDYPAECPYLGKRLSIRTVRALFAYLTGAGSWQSFLDSAHY